MFNLVLVHPEIPPNTGNAIRLSANTGCTLHLIEPLGFAMDDKLLRRAGLDYHEYAAVRRHADWATFMTQERPDPQRLFAFTSLAQRSAFEPRYAPGDWLVFGCETRGLPPELLAQIDPMQQLRLPMRPGQRSLNLSNAVAVLAFEAWRQQGFAGGVPAAALDTGPGT